MAAVNAVNSFSQLEICQGLKVHDYLCTPQPGTRPTKHSKCVNYWWALEKNKLWQKKKMQLWRQQYTVLESIIYFSMPFGFVFDIYTYCMCIYICTYIYIDMYKPHTGIKCKNWHDSHRVAQIMYGRQIICRCFSPSCCLSRQYIWVSRFTTRRLQWKWNEIVAQTLWLIKRRSKYAKRRQTAFSTADSAPFPSHTNQEPGAFPNRFPTGNNEIWAAYFEPCSNSVGSHDL